MGREKRRREAMPPVETVPTPVTLVSYATITGGGEAFTIIDDEDFIDEKGPFYVLTIKREHRRIEINRANIVKFDQIKRIWERPVESGQSKLDQMAEGPATTQTPNVTESLP